MQKQIARNLRSEVAIGEADFVEVKSQSNNRAGKFYQNKNRARNMSYWETHPDRIPSDFGIPEEEDSCSICGDPWNLRLHNPPQCRKRAEQQKLQDVQEDEIIENL